MTGAKRTFVSRETYESILDKPQLKPVTTMNVVADGRKVDCEAVMVLTFGEIVYEHPVIVEK